MTHLERLENIKAEMHRWMRENSSTAFSDAVHTSCVINSMQSMILEVMTEGMVIIAHNANNGNIWDVTAKLNALNAWSDECVAKLGALQ